MTQYWSALTTFLNNVPFVKVSPSYLDRIELELIGVFRGFAESRLALDTKLQELQYIIIISSTYLSTIVTHFVEC